MKPSEFLGFMEKVGDLLVRHSTFFVFQLFWGLILFMAVGIPLDEATEMPGSEWVPIALAATFLPTILVILNYPIYRARTRKERAPRRKART